MENKKKSETDIYFRKKLCNEITVFILQKIGEGFSLEEYLETSKALNEIIQKNIDIFPDWMKEMEID